MEYVLHISIIVCIYLILTESFSLIFGTAGLFNLAHVAVYAIGAYTTALLSTAFNVGFFDCLAASALCSGVFAFSIGWISLRISEEYFAIASLAFSSVISALLLNWKSLTNGPSGIPGIERPEVLGVTFSGTYSFFFLTLAVTAVSLAVLYLISRSTFARALRAMGENQYAAQAIALNGPVLRNTAFFVSSAFAGVAGSLFAYYFTYIDPTSFSLLEMIAIVSLVVVGRPGSFGGIIVSTIFLSGVLSESMRFLITDPNILGQLRQITYAAVLFGTVFIFRDRLFPARREI